MQLTRKRFDRDLTSRVLLFPRDFELRLKYLEVPEGGGEGDVRKYSSYLWVGKKRTETSHDLHKRGTVIPEKLRLITLPRLCAHNHKLWKQNALGKPQNIHILSFSEATFFLPQQSFRVCAKEKHFRKR